MVVSVNAAILDAPAGQRRLALQRLRTTKLRIAPCGIATIGTHRRPIRRRRGWNGFIESGEVPGAVDDLAADDGEIGSGVSNFILGASEEVAIRNDQVGEVARLDAPLFALFIREPGYIFGPHTQRCFTIEPVSLGIQRKS